MQQIQIHENNIYMVIEITEKQEVKLLHFSSLPFEPTHIVSEDFTFFSLVELMVSGQKRPLERFGSKYMATSPGYRLKYKSHRDIRNEKGRKLEFITYDEITKLEVTSHIQFYNGISVIRSWTEVKNTGCDNQGLEYVSSFALTGIEKEGILSQDDKMKLMIPHNSWTREMQWRTYTLPELGMATCLPKGKQRSSKAISVSNTGNWSTKEYLPMGYLENTETETNLFWQIEHNGSWHWEISDEGGHLYLQLSGPTEYHSHWWKELKPEETFSSVPVSVGVTQGNFDQAMGQLTMYRRIIRRENEDNKNLSIIFNDYMNCLFGDPTTEKEIPLIDAASKAGCEYYCIDCGWYSVGYWWDGVGEWLPSLERFPNGLKEVMDYIRLKGMIPGVWLELEVMGINCPKADKVNPNWYFQRHGQKVEDRSRYQLDFRNPEVIAHANEVIDRLVNEYGVGYIKMDYNIEPGIGTEINADSFGDGLLGHNRAYLNWLETIFEKYPNLVIENCSSGGLRLDYAMLSRYSIQSTSDQEDYRRYATIAANSPTGVTPEQSAIWSYPLETGDKSEVIFNMVNAILLRIHQSGHLANLSEERMELVQEALNYYKEIRTSLKVALPFWPLGLSTFEDEWVCLGMKTEKQIFLAVWKREASRSKLTIPISYLKGKEVKVCVGYPKNEPCSYEWNKSSGKLTIEIPDSMTARLFQLDLQ